MKLVYKFCRYKNIFIKRFFDYIIQNRIDNKYILKVFYLIFFLLQPFYFEKSYKEERQHYIPQPILENFAMSGNKGQIYQYSYGLQNPTVEAIKGIAQIPNYYSFTRLKDGLLSNFVEKNLLADIVEKFGKVVISDLLDEKYKKLISLEENILATYASFQYVRTPAFAEQLKVYLLYLVQVKNVTKDVFSNKRKDDMRDIFISNTMNVKDEDIRKFYLELKNSGIDYNSELSKYLENVNSIIKILFGLIGASKIKALFNKKKTIIEARDPYFFILPDSGSIIIDIKESIWLWPYGWTFEKESMILFIPLSPKKCLIFYDNRLKLDRNLTKMFIKLGIGSAYQQRYKYIYSDRKDKFIQKNTNKISLY